MPFVDKTLHCLDCGREFVFTATEQELYAKRGLPEPLRCKGCAVGSDAAATPRSDRPAIT